MNKHAQEHHLAQESITEALFQLMIQKPFSEINVTELVKKSGVARATYYRNYSSKEDILDKFFIQCLEAYDKKRPIRSLEDIYSVEYVRDLIKSIDGLKSVFVLLKENNMSSYFLNLFNKHTTETIKKRGIDTLSEEDLYRIYAINGAEFNVVFNMIIEDIEVTPEMISRDIQNIYHRIIKAQDQS